MGWPKASDWYASDAILKLIHLLTGSQWSSDTREVAELSLSWSTTLARQYHARTSTKYLYGCKYAAYNKQFYATFPWQDFFPHICLTFSKIMTFPWQLLNSMTFQVFQTSGHPVLSEIKQIFHSKIFSFRDFAPRPPIKTLPLDQGESLLVVRPPVKHFGHYGDKWQRWRVDWPEEHGCVRPAQHVCGVNGVLHVDCQQQTVAWLRPADVGTFPDNDTISVIKKSGNNCTMQIHLKDASIKICRQQCIKSVHWIFNL